MRRRVSQLLPWEKNHRMSAPPVRCRLLALEKPCSFSPARPPRRHDFARHRTDFQPPHSGHTCLFRGSLWLSKQPHKLFNTINIVRIIFTHHLFLWDSSCSCQASWVLLVPAVFRARAYSDWSPLTTPDHTALALCAFPQLGNSPFRFRRRRSFVPLVPPVCFVSTFAQTNSVYRSDFSVLYLPRASSQHRSLPSFYRARAARRAAAQFPISSTKRSSAAFASTSSQNRSCRCTARPSSDPLGLRGTIFVHSADGRPFSLQPSLPHDVPCISHASTALRWSHWTLSTC